ncbi:hypothetical protein [Streptomyces atroolivaceus]|uniref:hypothetical protein n=1 Tax=Streptomyces atroolivaceus TaxID=66869 RepID=UPI00342DC976
MNTCRLPSTLPTPTCATLLAALHEGIGDADYVTTVTAAHHATMLRHLATCKDGP